jgi:hypothetical protein
MNDPPVDRMTNEGMLNPYLQSHPVFIPLSHWSRFGILDAEASDPIHTVGDFGDTNSVLLVLNHDFSSCD